MKRRMKVKIIITFGLFLLSFVFLPSLVSAKTSVTATEKWPEAISIGTSPTLGSVYRLGIGYAKIINKYLGISVSPEATEGGGFNIAMMARGEMELGFIQTVQTYDAYRGVGLYKKLGRQPIRVLWVAHPGPVALATHAYSEIKTPADIRGKRYMFVVKGATAQTLYGDALLEAYGMTRKDCITQTFSGSIELIDAVKEKKTDVWHYPGSLVRHAVWEQITQKADVRFISIGEEQAASIHKKYPQYNFLEFPSNIYRNQDYSFLTAAWFSKFCCRKDFSEGLAYDITKVCWENRKELLPLDPLFGQFDLKSAVDSFNMPFHAGAIRYFKEKGVWGAKQEQLQKNLLQEMGEVK